MFKRGSIKSPCSLCRHFFESPERNIIKGSGGRNALHERKCKPAEKWVSPDDQGCKEFDLADFVWCGDQWVMIMACIGRQNNQIESCQNCRIGERIQIEIKKRHFGI